MVSINDISIHEGIGVFRYWSRSVVFIEYVRIILWQYMISIGIREKDRIECLT